MLGDLESHLTLDKPRWAVYSGLMTNHTDPAGLSSSPHYRVIADRDKGDDPRPSMLENGDRVTVVAYNAHDDSWEDGNEGIVRIERLVPTTAVWRDKQGDEWIEDAGSLMHSFETAPFPPDNEDFGTDTRPTRRAAPPSIANMAPGTKFRGPFPGIYTVLDDGRARRDPGCEYWLLTAIDPSTIRDVTPPTESTK